MPTNERYELICKKFEDSVNGDVNYPVFCQAIDEGRVISEAQIQDRINIKICLKFKILWPVESEILK